MLDIPTYQNGRESGSAGLRWPRREGLVLVAHGSQGWPDAMLLALAERLTSEHLDVSAAVLRGRPTLADALSTLACKVVHVVPVLMSQGQMAEALRARLPARHRTRLVLHPALGGHPVMPSVLGGLIERSCCEHGLSPGDTAVVLAGHGNARHPAAGGVIRDLAQRLRARSGFAEVHGVFLEQPPMVEDWPRLSRRSSVLVVPCFLSAGRHAREDVPRRLREAEGGGAGAHRRLCLAPPLATATDGLTAIVRDLVSRDATLEPRHPEYAPSAASEIGCR